MNKSDFSPKRLKELLSSPWLLPDKTLAYLIVKLRRSITLSPDSFGWLQAILYQGIDVWQRYASVAQAVKALDEKPVSILDVGGGTGTIMEFLSPKEYRLCVLDIKSEVLRRGDKSGGIAVIVEDGCYLPFKDNSFDVVVSVDCLEHVPDAKKAGYCLELKRVAKKYVVIHCPADSSDGRFEGTTYDTKFVDWYRCRFKKDDANTMEHLDFCLPKVEDLVYLFPEGIIRGSQNGEIWLKYMSLGRIAYVRFTVGILYKLYLQKRDNLPPYHACLLIWKKEALS